MKRTFALLFVTGAIFILLYNSCKKQEQSSIQTLFTNGTWQLASVQDFHFIGNSQVSTDTLNTKCMLTQFFTFSSGTSCTYTNFDCVTQPTATGTWALTPNQLFFSSDMVCKDTSAVGSSKPFSNTKIANLGQYSMILQTGDIAPNYSLTKKRTIRQYGFIRQKIATP